MSSAEMRNMFMVVAGLAAALAVAAWDVGGIGWARWPVYVAFLALVTAGGFAMMARDSARHGNGAAGADRGQG